MTDVLPDIDGLCRRYPDIEFVPDRYTQARAAIEVCEHCPVRAECARAALSTRSVGVWAGVYIPSGRSPTQSPYRQKLEQVV